MNTELGGLDQALDLAEAILSRIRSLGRNPRDEMEIRQTKQDRLKKRLVIFVQWTVDEDAPLEWRGRQRLALWRLGIAPIGIALTNSPVPTMDIEFGTLIARKLPPARDGLSLSLESTGGPRRAGPPNAPFVATRNNVLPFSSHYGTP
jgi:hypothetical protein